MSAPIQWVMQLQVRRGVCGLAAAHCSALLQPWARTHTLLTCLHRCLQQAHVANNFVGFFKLLRGAPYLMACLAHTYVPSVSGGERARRAPAHGCCCGSLDSSSKCLFCAPALPRSSCADPSARAQGAVSSTLPARGCRCARGAALAAGGLRVGRVWVVQQVQATTRSCWHPLVRHCAGLIAVIAHPCRRTCS